MSSVMICGSRQLPSAAFALIDTLVGVLLAHGRALIVGCAAGADRVALNAAMQLAPSRLSVLAAFGPGGKGAAGSASAVAAVQAAARAGVPVLWWAGGGPTVPLRARLAVRSLSAVRQVASSGAGAGLIAVVGSLPSRSWTGHGPWWSCGSGSWSSVAAADAFGLRVVVFPVGAAGLGGARLPALPSAPGHWAPAGRGVWSAGRVWVPDLALLQGSEGNTSV